MGLADYTLPALKGYLLRGLPQANIVDISHHVPEYDLKHAALLVGHCFRAFPENTLHILMMHNDSSMAADYLLARVSGQLLLLPDNGLLTLIIGDEAPEWVRLLEYQPADMMFPERDILVPYAIEVFKRGLDNPPGIPTSKYTYLAFPQPLIEGNRIIGQVIYVDPWGNSVTNISRKLVEQVYGGEEFSALLGRNSIIHGLKQHYTEVAEGNIVMLFGIGDLLEIAINRGSASRLLGLGKDTRVILEKS